MFVNFVKNIKLCLLSCLTLHRFYDFYYVAASAAPVPTVAMSIGTVTARTLMLVLLMPT